MNIVKRALSFFFFFSFLFISCKKELCTGNLPPTVDAGTDTVITLLGLKGDNIKLQGEAVDVDGTVSSYLWSQISGPNLATITDPGSDSTLVINIIPGNYVFQLMATDNKGATGVKTVSVKILAPEIQSITLQPIENTNEVSLGIWGGKDFSNPEWQEITASSWTKDGSPVTLRGLFKFNFDSLPAGLKVISAKLTLYSTPNPLNGNLSDANFGNDNSLFLQRVTTNWDNTVTWKSQPPSDTTDQITIPHTDESKLDITDLDVTSLVKSMIQKGNYGFLLKLRNEVPYTSRLFCSSRYSDVTKHPKLVLQYTK
ncbi:DNRLRE domain-containing protein [Segetibacter koreensis]|uniref:DNRLRE domain-containing protein n=1 Tax=Segetibacter koreensis TaxID=398037 RepID=UPI0003709104|nr:DNRLRE domain-containing protein [Segetibacter koreensis]